MISYTTDTHGDDTQPSNTPPALPVQTDDQRWPDESEFPVGADIRRQFEFITRFGILAPSSYNRQPWRFEIRRDRVAVLADRTRSMPVADPRDRHLIMSCGTALHHVRVAMTHFGIRPVVQTFPTLDEPDLTAVVRSAGFIEPSIADHQLFVAMRHRRTHRDEFLTRPVDEHVAAAIAAAALSEGVSATLVSGRDQVRQIADLVAEGERTLLADPTYVRDLAAWLPSSAWPPDAAAVAGWRDERAETLRGLTRSAPLLVILATTFDTAEAWLATGQAISHLLLRAREFGVFGSFVNQPVAVPSKRDEIISMSGAAAYPQIILRMGYGFEDPPTLRRAVSTVTTSV